MDTARCTRDAVTYTAAEFSGLGTGLEVLRRELVCARCGARAYFRRRTRDGKAACFGSNGHRPGCPAATEPAPREPVDDALAGLDSIQIDLDVRTNPTEPPYEPPGQTPQADVGEIESRSRGVTSRSLRTLLRHIVTEPAFLYSDAIVHARGFPRLSAREFFVRFEQINGHHVGQDRGYWGTVISIGTTVAGCGADLWLNAGRPGEPSVLIAHTDLSAVLGHARVDSADDLIGSHVLALGRCSTSGRGKVYITPPHLAAPHVPQPQLTRRAAGSWMASPSTHVGHELLTAGLLILDGGGHGKPLDHGLVEHWTKVGFERARAGGHSTKGF